MDKWLPNAQSFTILDGALGTVLQAAGLAPGQMPEQFMLEHPEKITDIHRAYVQAGAQVISANTFGANARKLQGSGLTVQQVVNTAVECAKQAAGGKARVALDVGPLGELLEPGGSLTFEEAYGLFAELMRAGQVAGAQLILIETMADLYEMKAAVLAAAEQTTLPVLASMTFEADGRSFTGVPVEAFAAATEGLGPVALGINCSLGPAEVMPLLRRLCAVTRLPVFAKPNAGLPNPATGVFPLSAEEFCAQMLPCLEMGVSMVGGCCGTTPQGIALLATRFSGAVPAKRNIDDKLIFCGATHALEVDGPTPVGERINPTGVKKLREALQAGDVSVAQALAVQQEADGALMLDVNVGAPGVDEVALLPRVVKAVQAVSGLPLTIDTANPVAMAAALRVYCGKPLVNSTSGEQAKMNVVLPLCKKYGAAVVGLALDEAGVPETAEGRLAVAEKLLAEAQHAGLGRQQVLIDGLVLAAGAVPGAGAETLRAVRLAKERLGVRTVLGVSNISFGLPSRPVMNQAFLAMALAAGLDMAFINPAADGMMGAIAAARLLLQNDSAPYLARYGGEAAAAKPMATAGAMPLAEAVEKGLKTEAAAAAKLLLDAGSAGMDAVEQYLIPALDAVGKGFEEKRLFLPQLLASTAAAQAAFEVLRSSMAGTGGGPPVVVATVQGDVHDIGKNIAKVLIENYGFTVTDLGRDVPPQAVVEAVQKTGARLVGLSALMTTTLPAMEETIRALRAAGLPCKVLVGGAVLTAEYAARIGADFYAKDAKASADYARQVYKKA